MAAIDFPASPALDQVFNASNGSTYQWNGTVWIPTGVSGSQIVMGDTPPATPNPGQLWFNSALGQLFIWYSDGTSSQWVPTNPVPVAAGGGIIREVIVTTPQPTIDLFSLGVKSVKLMFKLQPVTNGGDLLLRHANGTTPITTATYANLLMYNIHTSPTPPSGLFSNAATGYLLANLVSNNAQHWVSGEICFPDLTGRQQGTASVGFWQTVFLNFQGQLVGDIAGSGFNGLQFVLTAGNFAVGSFVRVIGWP